MNFCLELKKIKGRLINKSRPSELWYVVNYCKLIDMRLKDGKCTWLNKLLKNKYQLILERLDLFLANGKWIHYFPNA